MSGIWGAAWGATFGIAFGAQPTAAAPASGGGSLRRLHRMPVPEWLATSLAQQLIDEDELLMSMAEQIAASGLLTGSTNGKN